MNRNIPFRFCIVILLFTTPLAARQASEVLKPDLGSVIGSCPVCGMDVFEKMLTRVDLVHDDRTLHACALGCASALIEQAEPRRVLVVDFERGGMVSAYEAHYLFGSRVAPVRAMLPALSFASKEAAERMQLTHGGTLYYGGDAISLAARIRQERMDQRPVRR